MAITLDEFHKLERAVEGIQRQADEKAGQMKQLLHSIKEEFSCKSLEEAEQHLVELEQKEREQLAQYNKEKARFLKKYGKTIEEYSNG